MADELPTTATDAASPWKKGSRLRVIMLAAVIVAAIAGGVWFFAGSKSGDAVEPEQGVDAKHAAPKGPALCVEFDPPFVVNMALLRKEALDAIATVIAGEGGNAKHVEQLYFTSFVMQ